MGGTQGSPAPAPRPVTVCSYTGSGWRHECRPASARQTCAFLEGLLDSVTNNDAAAIQLADSYQENQTALLPQARPVQCCGRKKKKA